MNADVQCRNWFIHHNEIRVENQRARNADALPPPTVKLVWLAIQKPLLQTHNIHDGAHALQTLFFVPHTIHTQ